MPARIEGVKHHIPSRFIVTIDRERCKICKRCTVNCTFEALSYNGDRIVADNDKCVACQRCAMLCPQETITILENPMAFPPHAAYDDRIRRIGYEQAGTGGVMLSSCGNDLPFPIILKVEYSSNSFWLSFCQLNFFARARLASRSFHPLSCNLQHSCWQHLPGDHIYDVPVHKRQPTKDYDK